MQFNKNQYLMKFSLIATILVIGWIFLLLGKTVWQNWILRHSILKLYEQIAILEKQKNDLNNLIIYYRSDSFKELEARKRLGVKKPGEKMVILPVSPSQGGPVLSLPTASSSILPPNFPEEVAKEKEAVAGIESPSQIPNWLLWWQYFTR